MDSKPTIEVQFFLTVKFVLELILSQDFYSIVLTTLDSYVWPQKVLLATNNFSHNQTNDHHTTYPYQL